MRRRHTEWLQSTALVVCLHCGSSAESDSERSVHSEDRGGGTPNTELDGGVRGNMGSPAPPSPPTAELDASSGTSLVPFPAEPSAGPTTPSASTVDTEPAPMTPLAATGDASVGTTPEPATPGDPGDAGSELAIPTSDASTPPPLREPSPSAGCSLANDEPDERAATADFVAEFQFPASYDGMRPLPLVIGLPTTAGGIITIPQLGQDYVFVLARAENSLRTWEQARIEVFGELYALLRDNYCFDDSRVFGVGHGSGNTYLVSVLRQYPNTFHAIALHGAAPWRYVTTPVPTLLIHSESEWRGGATWDDIDGAKIASALSTVNECGAERTPTSSGYCGPSATNFECVDYSGCVAAFRFCQHDTPTRDPDLWTCFANEEIHSFFNEHL